MKVCKAHRCPLWRKSMPQSIALPPPNQNASQSLSSRVIHPTSAQHSRETHGLLRISVPANTRRSILNALKAFSSLVIDRLIPQMCSVLSNQDATDLLHETCRFVFPDGDGSLFRHGYTNWSEHQLNHILYYLIEFTANYKNETTGQDLPPSALKSYVLDIQLGFLFELGYELNSWRVQYSTVLGMDYFRSRITKNMKGSERENIWSSITFFLLRLLLFYIDRRVWVEIRLVSFKKGSFFRLLLSPVCVRQRLRL